MPLIFSPKAILFFLGYTYFLLFSLWRLIDEYLFLPGLAISGLPLLITRNLIELLIVVVFLLTTYKIRMSFRDRVIVFTCYFWLVFIVIKGLFAPIITYGVAQIVLVSQWLSIVAVGWIFAQQPIAIRIRMLIFFVFGVFILLFMSYYELYSGNIFFGGRLTYSSSANPATLAIYICLSIIVLMFIHGLTRYKLFIKFLLAFLMLSLILTQGRNSILAIFLSGLLVFLMAIIATKGAVFVNLILSSRITFGLLFFTILTFLLIYYMPIIFHNVDLRDMTYRLILLWSSRDANEITAGRIDIWLHYWELILNSSSIHFFLGHGPGLRHHEEMLPHNSFLTIFYEHGVLGLSIFLIIVSVNLLLYINLKKISNRYAIWLVIYSTMIMIGNDYMYSYLWLFFSIAIILAGNDTPRKHAEKVNRE